MTTSTLLPGVQLLTGQSRTSPLGRFVMEFKGGNLFVTPKGGSPKYIAVGLNTATYVEITPVGLIANTTPNATTIASVTNPIGLDVQDDGQIVIYNSNGPQWAWSYATGGVVQPNELIRTIAVFDKAVEAFGVSFQLFAREITTIAGHLATAYPPAERAERTSEIVPAMGRVSPLEGEKTGTA